MKKKIFITIAVLMGAWLLITGIDLMRFVSSNEYIEPIITLTDGGCDCGENKFADGLGYSFHYYYEVPGGYHTNDSKPIGRSFTLFGFKLYSE